MFSLIILLLGAFSVDTQAYSYYKPHYGVIEARRSLNEELDKPEGNEGLKKYNSPDGWDPDTSVSSNDFGKDLKPAEEISRTVDGSQKEHKFEETVGHDAIGKKQKSGSKIKQKCKSCKKIKLSEPKAIGVKKVNANFYYKYGKKQLGQMQQPNTMRSFRGSDVEKPSNTFAVPPASSVDVDTPDDKLNSTGESVKEAIVFPDEEEDTHQHIEELEDGMYLKRGRSMTKFGEVPPSLDNENAQYPEEKPSFEGLLKVVEENLRSYLNSF